MAHVAKYTQNQVGHLFNHYNRDKEKDCNRSNENIDKDLTKNNYNLMERDTSPQEYFDQRLNEIYHINRKDINVMVDWIVTLPEELKKASPEEQKEFFTHTVDFLNERYGSENCIGAFIHMDETTPHLHYSFIPVIPDHKHKDYELALNAKKVIDRNELQHFHKDFQEHIKNRMPEKEIKVYDDKEHEKKNRSLEYYKLHKEEEKLLKEKERIHKKEIEIKSKEKDLQEREAKLHTKEKDYERYFKTVDKYKSDHGLTETDYQRQLYQRHLDPSCRLPWPEAINPERSKEERDNIIKDYNTASEPTKQKSHEKER